MLTTRCVQVFWFNGRLNSLAKPYCRFIYIHNIYIYNYRSSRCASPACQWSTGLIESQLALPWMVIMQAYFQLFLFALIFELLRMILEASPVWQNLGHAKEWWGCKGFRRSTFSAVCHWDLQMRSNEHKPRNILYTEMQYTHLCIFETIYDLQNGSMVEDL